MIDRSVSASSVFLFCSVLAALMLVWPGVGERAIAEEFRAGNIAISHAWARPSAGEAKNGAAYITIRNLGAEVDTLLSAASPIADKTEIHEHIHDGDVMRMRRVDDGISVPAGQSLAFNPGGYHIMLLGLKSKLEEGASAPLKLRFAKAGEIEVRIMIDKTGGTAAP